MTRGGDPREEDWSMMEHDPTPRWTITKAEWDSISADGRVWRMTVWFTPAMCVASAAAMWGMSLALATGRGFADFSTATVVLRFLSVGALLYAFVEYFRVRRLRERWRRLHAHIWESEGLACPWCAVRIDTAPCRRHGFTPAQQMLLIRYWEATATKQIGRAASIQSELLAGRRTRGPLARVLEPFVAPFRAYTAAVNDADAAPFQRLRRAMPFLALEVAAVVVIAVVVYGVFGRSIMLAAMSGCWWVVLLAPITALAGPVWRLGRLRCAKCGQLCANDQQSVCPECGSDLTQPAAVTRRERRGRWRAAVWLLPAAVILGAPPIFRAVVGALPSGVQSFVYSWTRPPYGYFQNLNPSRMTQAEVDDALAVLISCAEPRGPRPVFDYDFLQRAMAAGKVTDATIERAARSVVQAELDVRREGNAIVATVTPAFGELIFGMQTAPRLVFGGVSVDGGAWTKGADWSLFLHDVDAFWRKNGQLNALPESKLVFTARAEGIPPGTHTVRARCWIVLGGKSWERYAPEFDANGALVPPSGATVYPLDLEATVTTR